MSELSKPCKDKNLNRFYYPELDGLRFLAFLLVFIHHHRLFRDIPFFSIIHTKGWIGVDLFFVLSAFLFTKLLIAEFTKTRTISLKKFYIRRIFRIWPIYFLFIGISLFIYFNLNDGLLSRQIGIRLLGLFTFSDNIFTAIKGYNPLPYIAHLWTISYEEQFYIFIPIIILLLVRSSFKSKVIIALAVFLLFNLVRLAFIYFGLKWLAIWVLPITHFESIIMGIIIGFGGMDFIAKKINPLILGFLGVLFFILIAQIPSGPDVSYLRIAIYTLVGITTSLILIALLNSHFLKTIFSIEMFVFLGKRSYGLYVYHLLCNHIANYLLKKLFTPFSNAFVSFLLSLSLTILVSIISYKYVEKPFLKWKKKFEVIISRPV